MDLGAELRSSLKGRYEVEEEVGRGGMSAVFRAQDTKHGRTVAVKVLRPELSQQVGADRFHQEVDFAANLNNPFVLPLFDSGQAAGCLFYTMPFVHGGSLAERIERDGPLDVEGALRIARNVAAALAAAHEHGIVHRDIKPGNILFSGGEAVVADFGIARAVASDVGQQITKSGIAVGSPAFMSPEQAVGDDVDERSDIYSLGCVLYAMLTAGPPFVRETVRKTISAHLTEAPPSVRRLRPEVSRGLDEIIRTALQKDPGQRFGTAIELLSALEDPDLIPGIASRRRRRRLARVIAATAVAGVAIAATGYLGWMAFAPAPLPAADANRVMVFPLLERGQTQSGAGLDAAIAIGNVLNYADPLNFVDGWTWLDAERRADVGLLTSDEARRLALRQGARWYVGGTILGQGDSATVTLLLYDAVADSSVTREVASGVAQFAGIADAGLDATTRLIPRLLDPNREFDPAILAASLSSHPLAMLQWVQGERAYRSSRIGEALEHYQGALRTDSTWAFASIKAAQAASWLKQSSLALDLVDRALESAADLPPKYASFARGLKAYLTGDPAVAEIELKAALEQDSAWAEPWAALGEVYYHLAPGWEDTELVAEQYFETSWASDTSFVVPLYHLTQIALREGDVERADRYVAALRRAGAEPMLLLPAELAIRCVRDGPASVDWDSLVAANASTAADVGLGMTNGLRQIECGKGPFAALLANESADAGWRRAAALAMAFIWLGEGNADRALALLDSTVADGEPGNMGYYPILAIAGYSEFDEAASRAMSYMPEDLAGANVSTLWFLGWWAHHEGDTARLREIVPIASSAAEHGGAPRDAGLAASLAARLAASAGDTTRAIELLLDHPPRSVGVSGLEHEWDSPLPFGRLLLTELLLARGEDARAMDVAEGFDGRPRIYLPLVPRSLAIRAAGAARLGDDRLAGRLEERLSTLALGVSRE